jgi:hypothetical protein
VREGSVDTERGERERGRREREGKGETECLLGVEYQRKTRD